MKRHEIKTADGKYRYTNKCRCGARFVCEVLTWEDAADHHSCELVQRARTMKWDNNSICATLFKQEQVMGRHSDKKMCGTQCLSSVGPTCDCSCAGENHGTGLVA